MENIKYTPSLRVGDHQWLEDAFFENLYAMLRDNKNSFDEISLFTAMMHSPLHLNEFERRMKIAEKRMEALRGLGFRAGINILATTGHHEENIQNLLQGFTCVVDQNGKPCRAVFCMNDPKFISEHVVPVYKSMCAAKPDYIWIDDDVRMLGHGPVTFTCFCDKCMKKFSEMMKREYTRETLTEALATDVGLRVSLLKFNAATITGLFDTIRRTVTACDASIELGFMTGERPYEGYDFETWAKTLSDGKKVKWRPGGGFYSDSSPASGMMEKVHTVGRQVAALPTDIVDDIQSEIENFPYILSQKSAKLTGTEAIAHIGAGCTGAAYNILSGGEDLDEFISIVKRASDVRAFCELVVEYQGREAAKGVWFAHDRYVSRLGSWFDKIETEGTAGIIPVSFLGLPTAYSRENAEVTILTRHNIGLFDKNELIKLLSRSVFLTAEALSIANGMGLSEYTGFEIDSILKRDAIEKLNNHSLNGKYAGFTRNCRQSFWYDDAYSLKPACGAEGLSSLINYEAETVAECASGVFTNKAGGRIYVSGYYPFEMIGGYPKSTQLKNIMRWLSGDTLCAFVRSPHKTALWARTAGGRTVLTLINLSQDDAENIIVQVKTNSPECEIYDSGCRKMLGLTQDMQDGYRNITVDRLAAFDAALIII